VVVMAIITPMTLADGREACFAEDQSILTALLLSNADGYAAVFMPEFARIRTSHPKSHPVWRSSLVTPSARFTGLSPQGKKVVAFVHQPNYLSEPANLALSYHRGLVNGAAPVPADIVAAVLREDGKVIDGVRVVSVVDAKTVARKSGRMDVLSALEDSLIVGFTGSRAIAYDYLPRHREFSGRQIGTWCSDDSVNTGRLLFLGLSDLNGFDGGSDLDNYGRLLGVRPLKGAAGEKCI